MQELSNISTTINQFVFLYAIHRCHGDMRKQSGPIVFTVYSSFTIATFITNIICYLGVWITIVSTTKRINVGIFHNLVSTIFFFLSFWRTHTSFLGPLVPLLWISGDVSSVFQSQSGLPYSHCGGERNVHSLRSTSGATHADLLVPSTQPVLSPHTVAEVRLPGFELVLSEYL